MSVAIRPAYAGEAGVALAFIRELADYERRGHEVDTDETMIDAPPFGASPRAFRDIAERDGAPVGFAVWFHNFSTFRRRHGIYLEDLYVCPPHRGQGIGTAPLSTLARRCAAEGLPRLDWWVLDRNAPSVAFCRGLGAQAPDDRTVYRPTGEPLNRPVAERQG